MTARTPRRAHNGEDTGPVGEQIVEHVDTVLTGVFH
ncbi:hypothetical protein N806_15870 [Rhodococcus sp. P27]|nr:hypothetical protein N601_19415 [Rhodococcus erythropolis DN1]ERB52643.1 hypothetical protein N806_15870 [Rhodococcus sp. P27]